MFDSNTTVAVTICTCMGKGHYFTVPFFTKAYGDTSDKLLFIDAVDLSPTLTSEQRQNSIVPNTEIPTLLKSERCCSIIVESRNYDQTLKLTFTGKLSVNDNHSINYDKVEHRVTLNNREG